MSVFTTSLVSDGARGCALGCGWPEPILAFNGAVPILNKDMTLCISLSARPSNNGTRFHNHLYEQLGLNWIYKAFAPTDLAQAIAGVRGLGIRGCAVSMPYKEDVIALVDVMDPSAKAIDSVNTIVNDGGRLTAYNTDYTAIEQLLQSNAVPTDYSVLVLGAGGMAKATVAALRDAGFKDVTVVARNEGSGRALAEQYGFAWRADLGSRRPVPARRTCSSTSPPSGWPAARTPTRCPSRRRPSTPPRWCSTSSRCRPRRR